MLDAVQPRPEGGKPALVVERHVDEAQRPGERLPRRLVDRPPRKLRHTVFRERAVVVVAHLLAADADDSELRRQEVIDVQVVEGG
jgi:hypothetical protein